MEHVMEFLFANKFFELPILEALSYIVAVLTIGAGIMALFSTLTGETGSKPATVQYHEERRQAA
ncbi:hypothetical protein W02_36270 [Nitrospira sp. KM1]|uniref:hypothetical protein n=1 Tax=Nitrospira sp. KM1 TaxID=1936990 RepID=UPI0013A7B121|nr:hypothetical protein [Nitrospira sp. KM1]BCA56487.1 hypothetical protein W02_36270 [Nitrospira sp. KM1]